MELTILASLAISTFFTALGVLSHTTKRTIVFLALQAASIGFVELVYCLLGLITGLHMEALISFLAAFVEWFTSAAVSPLIIYWGTIKTEDVSEKPLIRNRKVIISIVVLTVLWLTLGCWFSNILPERLNVLPFVVLMLLFSSILIVYRKDPFKILVGLNMAENSLYPLIAESPISLVPFMLGLMVFVNLVGVFVVMEAYRDYGTTLVSKWRLNG